MTCLHCGATTSNGLALCGLCQRKALADLEFLPVYFRNLARWRPGRAGSRPVPSSRVLYVGDVRADQTGDRISDALDAANNTLTTWARALADDRPDFELPESDDPAGEVTALCSAFEARLTTVATLGWAGEFVYDLGTHEAVLRGLTEVSVPGWYAGRCRRCEVDTYAVPGLTWVTCGGCGATTYARDHIDVILKEARGWVARPMRLAEALVALIDSELSVPRLHKRISKWGERDQIATLRRLDSDGDPVGPKRHRLGEVLDRLLSEGQTRLGDTSDVVTGKAS